MKPSRAFVIAVTVIAALPVTASVAASVTVAQASGLPVTALAFSPDGTTLYSSGYKEILVWSVKEARLTRRIEGLSGRVRALAVSPDTRTLAVAEGVPGRSGAVSLIDIESGTRTVLHQATDEMLAVAFHPNGKLLAFGGADSIVHVWNTGSGKETATLKDQAGWINGLGFSIDGKILASSSADGTVFIWDPATWKEIFRLPQTPTDPVNGLAFSPDGEFLAFAVGGQTEHAIRSWRVANAFTEIVANRPGQRNALMQTRPADTGACLPLAVAWAKLQNRPRPIAACADNSLAVLGPNGGVAARLSGHTDWVYTVAVSPDGTRIASGSGDGSVKLWDVQGKLVATLTTQLLETKK